MQRVVVISVLCMCAFFGIWHYELSLVTLMTNRAWVWVGALVLGSGAASMWLCPRTAPHVDMSWYLALFPGVGLFGAGIGWQCDDSTDVHGRQQ